MIETRKDGSKKATMTTSVSLEQFTEILKFCQKKGFNSLSKFLRYAVCSAIEPTATPKKNTKKQPRKRSIHDLLAEFDNQVVM